MHYSFYQLYRRNVLILVLLLGGLLGIGVLLLVGLNLRGDYGRELQTQARMIASQMADAMPLEGVEKVEKLSAHPSLEVMDWKLLRGASANRQLIFACGFDAKGTLLSAVQGLDFSSDAPSVDLMCRQYLSPEVVSDKGAAEFFRKLQHSFFTVSATEPLVLAGMPHAFGSIYLVASLPSLWQKSLLWVLGIVGILLLFLLFSWMLGKALRRVVLRPLRQIASTAQRVTLYKDYSLRVSHTALVKIPMEIELLIESFNGMLKEIEDRDTRLTRKTIELEQSRLAAEAASRAKSNFLANVSHELRTPLNAIIGFSSMLEGQQFGPLGNEKYQEYAHDIHDSGKHLLDVINDILDLSKAESGKLTVRFESFAVTRVVEKALHMVGHQALEKRLVMRVEMPDRFPRMVGDRVRILQILLNLLSNAVKFTPEGGEITLRMEAETLPNHAHYFTIEIEDTGIGMTQEELSRVFQAFHQADAGLNRKYEGTGLGLPLTKRLVELHHGKIKIESIKGAGTKVTIRLLSDAGLLD